jgi:hypothetical protein
MVAFTHEQGAAVQKIEAVTEPAAAAAAELGPSTILLWTDSFEVVVAELARYRALTGRFGLEMTYPTCACTRNILVSSR